MTNDDKILREIEKRMRARLLGDVPEGFNSRLHKMVGQAIGARVERDGNNYRYYDERGKSKDRHGNAVDEDAAWYLSDESWTTTVRDANQLFEGLYDKAPYAERVLVWLFDELELSAQERCLIFLAAVDGLKSDS